MNNTKRINELSKVFQRMLDIMWLEYKHDPSLNKTPYRIAKMMVNETCVWLYSKAPRISVFNNTWNYDWMVLVKNMAVKSICEHHFQPFVGVCHIAYIPGDKIIWISKLSRIVDYFSRRPQVQERLTTDIFNFLKAKLLTDDIAIYIKAEHFCMKIRWVNEHKSETLTTKLWWVFMEDWKVRQEFYEIIK